MQDSADRKTSIQDVSNQLERISNELFSEQENILVSLDLLFYHLGIPTQNFLIDYKNQDPSNPRSTPTVRALNDDSV